jgi:hypothetical protein
LDLKTTTNYFLPTKTPHLLRHTETETKRIENSIPSKCNLEATKSSYIYTQKRNLQETFSEETKVITR